MKIRVGCLIFIICNLIHNVHAENFKLITSLYNEPNPVRAQEYITCLEKNLTHAGIDAVHVIYDVSRDDANNTIYTYLLSKGVSITLRKGRPTYGECFDLAGLLFPNCRIILANADIYFNETLLLLNSYNLHNKFLALTRWNVLPDNRLEIFKQYNQWGEFEKIGSETSQDVWIFQLPLPQFPHAAIQVGTMQCDSQIAYQAYLSGLEVLNPCLSIQCCHLHLSDIRNYDPYPPLDGIWMSVPWQEL